MDASHSPGMLRGSWTMARSPGGHPAVVDGTKGGRRNTGHFRDLRKGLDSGVLGVEPRGVGRFPSLDTLVCLPGHIRLWVLETHLRPSRSGAFPLAVLAPGESTMILYRPIHCLFLRKRIWVVQK